MVSFRAHQSCVLRDEAVPQPGGAGPDAVVCQQAGQVVAEVTGVQ